MTQQGTGGAAKESPTGRSDAGRGLYQKFSVTRLDGADLPGCRREGARYFVMDYRYDPFGWVAVASYAVTVAEYHPALARDLAAGAMATLPQLRADPKAEAVLVDLLAGPIDESVVVAVLKGLASGRPPAPPVPLAPPATARGPLLR